MAVAMSEEPPRDATSTDERRAQRYARTSRPMRLMWLLIGWLFFALGLIGAFLPVLPTTGFWILAVIAFERSNPRIASKIRSWPHFGPAVSTFLDHGVITRRGKIAALSAMALCAALLIWLSSGVALWAGLGGIALGALYVGTRPSRKREPSQPKRDA